MVMERSGLRIAVVGGGVAGITAATLLDEGHEVTIFERNDYLGGHTNTRVIADGMDQGTPVDTGFIVCNPANYPHFYRLLGRLGVGLRDCPMSFGFFCEESRLQYVGPSLLEFLAVPRNFFRGDFVRMLLEQRRFNRRVLEDLAAGRLADVGLGKYLGDLRISEFFVSSYLVPLMAAIWSSPDTDVMDFPAATFATFFRNHGMLELSKRPQWQTVVGGSHAYVAAFRRNFRGKVLTAAPVQGIQRQEGEQRVRLKDGSVHSFDRVVLAAHADESLKLLEKPSIDEARLLGAWRYSRNATVLHTDDRILPGRRRLWAAWNYGRKKMRDRRAPVAITYYMNRLQGLKTRRDYFVTLNRGEDIDRSKIIYETEYTHPIYTPASVTTQPGIRDLNGRDGSYFCGSYLGYGFHEDAVRSAVEVAGAFGARL